MNYYFVFRQSDGFTSFRNMADSNAVFVQKAFSQDETWLAETITGTFKINFINSALRETTEEMLSVLTSNTEYVLVTSDTTVRDQALARLENARTFTTNEAGETVGAITDGGSSGTDNFTATPEDQSFDGGDGLDSFTVTGNRDTVSVSKASDGTLTVTGATVGTDTLVNIERIKFSDGTLAFDDTGSAGQTYRLYQAAFKRTPDEAGLSHNVNLMDGGMSIYDMANAFIGSLEFQNTYGANVDDTQFLTLLYQNVLGRAPDDAGLAGWLSRLQSGTERKEVLFGFSESAENKATVAPAIDDGIWLV